MPAPKRIRWDCPTGSHPGVLGPRRPRRDDIVRYCLDCSQATGRLVERTAPALERARTAGAERAKSKAAAKRASDARARRAKADAETARYTVEGVDLRDELDRLRRLPIFAGDRLARRGPEFKVTRCRTMPRTVIGRAWPTEYRFHLSLWPDITLASARATMVHELAHLWVGRDNHDRKAWHGEAFQRAIRRIFKAAYGLDGPPGYRGASSFPFAAILARAERFTTETREIAS